jgi:membrane-associated protein
MLSWISLISLGGLFAAWSSVFSLADAAGGPETLQWWLDMVLHLDDKLKELVKDYGVWTHLILFAVIFCETGLVVTPFLPGDSLLFAAGAFAADRTLRIEWLIPLLIVAAILGDTVNYWLGHWLGEHVFNSKIPFLTKANLDKTHAYFEKYGGTTIIIARFVPIIRTFAPFVAGIGSMNYRRFFFYNIIGGVVWVLFFVGLGYQFGRFDFVQKNFKLVMVAIVVLSVVPVIWEWWCHRARQKKVA